MTNIYAPLKRYFLSLFFTLVLSLIPYIITNNTTVAIVVSVISIIFSIVQIHSIYCMRESCERIKKSFKYFIISLIGTIITSVVTVAAAFISIELAAFLIFILFGFLFISIISNFLFIWGLDDLVVQNGYNYPKGKIKWMFWLNVINTLLLSMLEKSGSVIGTLIVGTVCSVFSLWLLYEYLQAVNEKENSGL